MNLNFLILILDLTHLIKKFTWKKSETDAAMWIIKVYLKKSKIFLYL